MTAMAHITHEAVEKVGGIGAVLQGLLTSRAYRESVERSILVGPLFDPSAAQPLGPRGVLLYDRLAGVGDPAAARALEEVEREHGVRLVYGRRPLAPDVTAEVLLVDVTGPPRGLAGFKHELYRRFGLTSDRYETDPEYEQYVRLAGPAFDAVARLVPAPSPCCLVAHEFMGLPTAFRSILSADPRFTTLFHAHEVATVRRIVEGAPGQDVMFYNAMRAAAETGAGLEEVFGSQDDYFKHALVRRAWHCDKVLAVGDLVMRELAFLGNEFRSDPPLLVYNGVEAGEISPGDRKSARDSSRRVRGAAPRFPARLRPHPRVEAGSEQGAVAGPAGLPGPRRHPGPAGPQRRAGRAGDRGRPPGSRGREAHGRGVRVAPRSPRGVSRPRRRGGGFRPPGAPFQRRLARRQGGVRQPVRYRPGIPGAAACRASVSTTCGTAATPSSGSRSTSRSG